MQEVRVAEESVRKDHRTDQDIQDGEEGDEDPYSASQEITPNQYREIVKIEDQGDLLNEVGADEGGYENDAYDNFLKMSHYNLLKTFHSLFPPLRKPRGRFLTSVPCDIQR